MLESSEIRTGIEWDMKRKRVKLNFLLEFGWNLNYNQMGSEMKLGEIEICHEIGTGIKLELEQNCVKLKYIKWDMEQNWVEMKFALEFGWNSNWNQTGFETKSGENEICHKTRTRIR